MDGLIKVIIRALLHASLAIGGRLSFNPAIDWAFHNLAAPA
jgi:hypothetical protein